MNGCFQKLAQMPTTLTPDFTPKKNVFLPVDQPKPEDKIMQKNQKGFTIVELIVVIAIIGLLSGIVATNTTRYIAKAKQARVKQEFGNIEKALSLFYDKYGSYPGEQSSPVGAMAIFCPNGTTCYETKLGTNPNNGIGYLSEFYKINWDTANATYYGNGYYYQLAFWNTTNDNNNKTGNIGCARIFLCTSSNCTQVVNQLGYKYILCQDCPENCGGELYKW